MVARIQTTALVGVQGVAVDVEVRVRGGSPSFVLIGLGDSAVRESRDRVCSALRMSGHQVPEKILVNLAPAELRKVGSGYDLAIAIGILVASGQLRSSMGSNRLFLGELALDGKVKGARGALAHAIYAVGNSIEEVVVSKDNEAECALVKGVRIIGVESLNELVQYLRGELLLTPRELDPHPGETLLFNNFDQVIGQAQAKRALTIAACGNHNALMIGPPGCGKTMLAKRFSTLLPKPSYEETLEIVKIHSIAGSLSPHLIQGARPFRTPHYSASEIGLVGGGTIPRPGEITLAHRGVLFLDELPEFQRSAIEHLRGPLEEGKICITRAKESVVFPARFQLIAAMNPCPCGRLGALGLQCLCSPRDIAKYIRQISQPVLDRIDLHLELEGVPLTLLLEDSCLHQTNSPPHEVLARQAEEGRGIQLERQKKYNSELSADELRTTSQLSSHASQLLDKAVQKFGLSARGYVRVLRVARTIADLEKEEYIQDQHLAEAIGYRGLDRLRAKY